MREEQGKITGIFVYEKRGASPQPVDWCQADTGEGLSGDWHGEKVDRQVSILSAEAREQKEGFCMKKFKENIRTEGIDLSKVQPGDLLETAEVSFEITGVFKKCYPDLCPLAEAGKPCLLKDHALFAKVAKGGKLRQGETVYKKSGS